MTSIFFIELLFFPSASPWLLLGSILGEYLFKDSKGQHYKGELEISFILGLVWFFSLFFSKQSFIELISNSLISGTYLLAISHEFTHKYKLYKYSIFYREHLNHHSNNDQEAEQRRENSLPRYTAIRIIAYFNLKNWNIYDLPVFGLFVISLYFNHTYSLFFLTTLFVVESIGYLQHSIIDDSPIDWTNGFNNYMGFGCGYHSSHHKKSGHFSKDGGVITGVIFCYIWGIICLGLFPLMYLMPIPKANIPGAYLFGFRQNVANYMATNGRSIMNLIYRMPSVFDQPSLIVQYIMCMFDHSIKGKVEVQPASTKEITFNHGVSKARNIHFNATNSQGDVLIYKGKVIEGHHRYQANKFDNLVEIVEII